MKNYLNWLFLQSPYDACETPKESESPRFKAIMQATSAPRKRFPADIKSFSHELNSKGVRPFPFWKPRSIYNLKVITFSRFHFYSCGDDLVLVLRFLYNLGAQLWPFYSYASMKTSGGK